jgi:hypothetical protein
MNEVKTHSVILHRILPVSVLLLLLAACVNWLRCPDDYSDAVLDYAETSFVKGAYFRDPELEIILPEGFLNVPSREKRESFMDSLEQKRGNVRIVNDHELHLFYERFKNKGIGKDTCVQFITAERGFCSFTIEDITKFYSTRGIGYSHGSTVKFTWLFGWHCGPVGYSTGNMRGVETQGVDHKPPFRHLPSNPDYKPVGSR